MTGFGGMLVNMIEFVLALAPLATSEASHARQCNVSLSLWNDTLQWDDSFDVVVAWMASSSFFLGFRVWQHNRGTHVLQFDTWPRILQRRALLLILLWALLAMQQQDIIPNCEYSLPLWNRPLCL